jgi:hypothetical protein
MGQQTLLKALLVRWWLATRETRLGQVPGCARPKRSVTPAVALLLSIGLVVLVRLLCMQSACGAGIGIDGQLVRMDLGTITPNQPAIWSNALQMTLWSSTPWYLSIAGEGPLLATDDTNLPLERLSWALITSDAVAQWSPMSTTPSIVVEDVLPTKSEGENLTIGLRVDPAWSDPPGGPYSTRLHVALTGGTDLIPSYVWPQPAVVGEEVRITYFSGGDITQPDFPVTLAIQDKDALLAHNEVVITTPEQWHTFTWATKGSDLGTYHYRITGPDAVLLAQGTIELLAHTPDAGLCSVTGVVSTTGTPLADVQVRLYDSVYRQVGVTLSNVAGEFAFHELPVGGYHLEVLHPGYLPWQSERFYLDETTTTQHVPIELAANNAMLTEVDFRIVRVISGEQIKGDAAGHVQAGDIVEVAGVVRNTGTRSLHAPVVNVAWPSHIDGLCTTGSSVCSYTLPTLKPGQSAPFQTRGVVQWTQPSDPFLINVDSTQSVKIDAYAWAQNADDSLTPVYAATRYLTLNSRKPSQLAGYLAMQLYWDRNENGQMDPNEEGVGGVELRLSNGERFKTQMDGWAYAPLSDELVSVWLVRSTAAQPISRFTSASALSELLDEDILLYQGVIRPGVVEVVRIGLSSAGTPTQPPPNQLSLLWTPGSLGGWQALGHLRAGGENWQLSLDLPQRFHAAYFTHPASGSKQFHKLSMGQSTTKPYLMWHSQIQTTSSEHKPQNVIDAQAAIGYQEPMLWERFPLLGSGPYQLPTRIKAVDRVVGCYLGEPITFTEQQYTWSPTGTLWLTQPSQTWLSGPQGVRDDYLHQACIKETENVLYVLFLPEVSAGVAYPTLAASFLMQTHPEAIELGGQNDQWRLQWLYPWTQDEDARWRWGFARQKSGSRFAWEVGTFADPGFDLANAWVVALPGSNDGDKLPDETLGPLRGLPLYINVEHGWQGKDWLLHVDYKNLRSWRKRSIKGAWRFQTPIAGDIGLVLYRMSGDVPTQVGAPGLGMDLTLNLQHSFGQWVWQLRQRFPLWLKAAESISEMESTSKPLPSGAFRISWQAIQRQGIEVALQLNTQSLQGALDLFWRWNRDTSVQIAAGMRCQTPVRHVLTRMLGFAGNEKPTTLTLSWTPWLQAGWKSAQYPYGAEVQFSYQGGNLPIARMSWRLGSLWTQIEWSEQKQRVHMWYSGNQKSSYLALQLQYDVDKRLPEAALTGRITWQGLLPYLGDGVTGSINVQWGAYHNDQSELAATSGVLATSIRKQFGMNAVAIGTNWPWHNVRSMADANSIAQQSACAWLLWERRLLQSASYGLWGGLELRYAQGTWAPRWQISLK